MEQRTMLKRRFSFSKKSNLTPFALREKRLKFAPSSTIVAPQGKLRPIFVSEFMSLSRLVVAGAFDHLREKGPLMLRVSALSLWKRLERLAPPLRG
jgi:hypothetical protein